jgi:putative DNA primase/helicase
MTAAEIAQKLGNAQAEGKEWRCNCPVCNHHNLSLCDNGERLLVKCFNGCANQAVLAELGRLGLFDGKNGNGAEHAETRAEHEGKAKSAKAKRQARIDNALDTWRNSFPATDSMVATYLASRLLLEPVPATLRLAPAVWHKEAAARFPAMVGLVEHPEHGAVGIHAVYLNRLDASVRFTTEPRKRSFGALKGGCVRLAPPGPVLAIAEGIEDALTFMRATGTPSWAAITATGVESFVPPPLAETATIILCEDQDENQTGQKAVAAAAARLAKAGYEIKIARPTFGKDVNEALLELGFHEPLCTIVDYQPDGAAADAESPIIRVAAGRRHEAADQGLAALAAAAVPFYQRDRNIVRVCNVKGKASDGSLVFTPAIVEVKLAMLGRALGLSAHWERLNNKGDVVHIDPPKEVVEQIAGMVGEWPFSPLYGIIGTPTLRPDGSLRATEGYDEETGLVLINVPAMPAIAEAPTKAEAEGGLRLLDELLDEFPFADETSSRSVALSMLMTPVLRGALPPAVPLHLIKKPLSGTGASYLADVASAIYTGDRCPVIAMTPDPRENEKRLVAAALVGYPIIAIDNCNGLLSGDFLCQLTERPILQLRPLGSSEQPRIPNSFTVFANGNNITVAADVVRRTLRCTLDANMENPELRTFKHNPVAMVLADRGRYVAACLTIARAYLAAGSPQRPIPLPSYEAWSNLVHAALIWLGRHDPVDSLADIRDEDPVHTDRAAVFTTWAHDLGCTLTLRANQIIEYAEKYSALKDALLTVASATHALPPRIDANRLGRWLRDNVNTVAAGFKLTADRTDKARPKWGLKPLTAETR